jgi:hypothetical protein
MNPEKATLILTELIQKPGIDPATIPDTFKAILDIYNTQFAPPPEPIKKRRRRATKNGVAKKNIGWPKGVTRAEYLAWRETTWNSPEYAESRNPWGYLRMRDMGAWGGPPGTPYPESPTHKRELERHERMKATKKAAKK